MKRYIIISFILTLLLSGCAGNKKKPVKQKTNHGRYALRHDNAPEDTSFDPASLQPWQIQPEQKSRYGNHSPYIVFGKTYYLEDTNHDFEQTGMASWYGKKFHGHKTSNMEVFDMYKLTAAHRTLPLPSYVEVTNLENNKKVIVRVNDRGPFKSKRIIDLSWAAAKALDYDKKGLTKVHLKLVQAPGRQPEKIKPSTTTLTHQQENKDEMEGLKFLQVGAFSDKNHALNIASELSELILLPVHVTDAVAQNTLYRVRIGPLSEDENIIDIIQKVHLRGFMNTRMVVE